MEEKLKLHPNKSGAEFIPKTKWEGSVEEQIRVAIEKLGKENVFGPKEIEEVFGVRLDEEIPFSVEELEHPGQMLIFRVNKTADGGPMSLEAMIKIMARRWENKGMGDLLSTVEGWKAWMGEEFFTQEAPRAGWALVSKDVLPESLNKNYLEQTEVIIATLKNRVFKDMEMPEEYAAAIEEFESKKDELARLIDDDREDDDWEDLTREFVGLKITQLTRPTILEMVYDVAVFYDRNNERLLSNKYGWSASGAPTGSGIIDSGGFDSRGVDSDEEPPNGRRSDLGVSLSRRS